MKLLNRFVYIIEKHQRHRALVQFRAMPERLLVDCGISSELLIQGVRAWPWQAPQETTQSSMRIFATKLESNRSDNIPDHIAIPEQESGQRFAA